MPQFSQTPFRGVVDPRAEQFQSPNDSDPFADSNEPGSLSDVFDQFANRQQDNARRNEDAAAGFSRPGQFNSIDELIEARTPESLEILSQGAARQLDLVEQGRSAGSNPLRQFAGIQGFNEQQSLLGNFGNQAQSQAIRGIPVSAFDRELQRRQQVSQSRQASARGERGAGATLLGAQQLRGGQQADIIAKRLAQLEPLSAASRGVRSTLSGIEESAAARQAQIQQGVGSQSANIRLGAAAPQIQLGLERAELSGLRGISRANQQGQVLNQLSTLAGRFIPPASTTTVPQAPVGVPVQQQDFSGFA